MDYQLTRSDVAGLSGEGYVPDEPLLCLAPGASRVAVHVVEFAECADGALREVVVSSMLVTTSLTGDADSKAESVYMCEQVAIGLTRSLAPAGTYAIPDPLPLPVGDDKMAHYVEVATPLSSLKTHTPPGRTWADVLVGTLDLLVET